MSPNRRLNDFLKALEGKIGRANALRELVECCKVAGRYPGTGVVSRKPRNFRQPINMACLALGR